MKYLLQRIAFYILTAWAAITLNFFIPRMIPGDPVKALRSRFQGQMSSDAINSLYVLFGIDENASLWSQYIDYWKQLAHGDLGLSFTAFPSAVSEVIADALPWTVCLVGITTIISFFLGTGLGVLAGWRRGSWTDGLLPATTFLSSVPYFWLGLLAIFLLVAFQVAVSAASLRWSWVRKLTSAEPAVLYHDGRFAEATLRRERVCEDEVVSAVHQKGMRDLDQVDAVILGANGELCVLVKDGDKVDQPALRAGRQGRV